MWYRSTRYRNPQGTRQATSQSSEDTAPESGVFSFSSVLDQGLADDGGLYLPSSTIPQSTLTRPRQHFSELATEVMRPFLTSEEESEKLQAACASAFDFALPCKKLCGVGASLYLLELFHGPTAAFKDFGARFLARWWAQTPQTQQRTVLVATSGDTGGAVASAFWKQPGFRVVILFPEKGVSPRQKHQLCAWGENVCSLAVEGTFDDCQRLVKQAFADPDLKRRAGLVSANSINWGRLLPQVSYYAEASLRVQEIEKSRVDFIVPSGNLGNGFAAWIAREMGFPIRNLFLAFNANRAVPDYFESGKWTGQPTVSTLANAMDVSRPSNWERFEGSSVKFGSAPGLFARSVSDPEIRESIESAARLTGEILCPHTATGFSVWKSNQEKADRRTSSQEACPSILVATAHAAKFDSIVDPIVEPILGRKTVCPAALSEILRRPARFESLRPHLEDLKKHLAG
jgi:threonine synthase